MKKKIATWLAENLANYIKARFFLLGVVNVGSIGLFVMVSQYYDRDSLRPLGNAMSMVMITSFVWIPFITEVLFKWAISVLGKDGLEASLKFQRIAALTSAMERSY